MSVKCKYCGEPKVNKSGFRKRKFGKIPRFRCPVCGKRFIIDTAFINLWFEPDVVVETMNLYVSGMSLRSISQHMKSSRGIEISHMCIYRWIRKFSPLLLSYTRTLKINGQDIHLHADETMVKIKGDWVWFWSVMSKENRFIVADIITKTRKMDECKQLFKFTRERVTGLPSSITTDGLGVYPRAIRSVFPIKSYPHVEHIVALGITKGNNLIERHFNHIKGRIKTMRGFGEISSCLDILRFINIHFNFVRKNISLDNKSPSEVAGLGSYTLKSLIEEAHDWNRRTN
jgi:transposase-like protein